MNSLFHVCELICPNCRDELAGLPADKVFGCMACKRAYFFKEGQTESFSLFFAPMANQSESCVCYLPFWKVDVQVTVRNPKGEDVTDSTAARNMSHAWVCAFYEFRPAYFGNPGLDFTASQLLPLCQEEVSDDVMLVGVERTPKDAARYVTIFVTSILDKANDVTGYDIDVSTGKMELWALPFAINQEDGTLMDLCSEKQYSMALVEYLNEIRQNSTLKHPA